MHGVANLHVPLDGVTTTLDRRQEAVEVKVLRDHIVYRPENAGHESKKPDFGSSSKNKMHAGFLQYSLIRRFDSNL